MLLVLHVASSSNQTIGKTLIYDLEVALEEKSEDHKSSWDTSSENHEHLCKMLCQSVH